MSKKVFVECASTRAHAAILNALEIEVITRRDTVVNVYDRNVLRLFSIARAAFQKSWDVLMPNVDSISFANAWDTHISSVTRRNAKKINELVNNYIRMILEDVTGELQEFMPVMSLDAVAGYEEALTKIVGVKDSRNLLVMV